MKFYRVVPYSARALEERVVNELLLGVGFGSARVVTSHTLYHGPVLQNPVLVRAVTQLAQRCPACNCVRIERT